MGDHAVLVLSDSIIKKQFINLQDKNQHLMQVCPWQYSVGREKSAQKQKKAYFSTHKRVLKWAFLSGSLKL